VPPYGGAESTVATPLPVSANCHPDHNQKPQPAGRNNALNFGIDRILDGLAAFIATHQT
jgi:hypothetical protein